MAIEVILVAVFLPIGVGLLFAPERTWEWGQRLTSWMPSDPIEFQTLPGWLVRGVGLLSTLFGSLVLYAIVASLCALAF